VGTKFSSLFSNLAQVSQTPHLETAGISQQRSLPSNEPVQTSARPYYFYTGSQPKVVSVAEYDAGTEIVFERFETNAFNSAGGSNRHEDGRLYRSASGGKHTCARLALTRHDLKIYWRLLRHLLA
jgi:hypothetical protein